MNFFDTAMKQAEAFNEQAQQNSGGYGSELIRNSQMRFGLAVQGKKGDLGSVYDIIILDHFDAKTVSNMPMFFEADLFDKLQNINTKTRAYTFTTDVVDGNDPKILEYNRAIKQLLGNVERLPQLRGTYYLSILALNYPTFAKKEGEPKTAHRRMLLPISSKNATDGKWFLALQSAIEKYGTLRGVKFRLSRSSENTSPKIGTFEMIPSCAYSDHKPVTIPDPKNPSKKTVVKTTEQHAKVPESQLAKYACTELAKKDGTVYRKAGENLEPFDYKKVLKPVTVADLKEMFPLNFSGDKGGNQTTADLSSDEALDFLLSEIDESPSTDFSEDPAEALALLGEVTEDTPTVVLSNPDDPFSTPYVDEDDE